MDKFSFQKALWHPKDPEWVKGREQHWQTLKRFYPSINLSKEKTFKKYLLKGEWTYQSKYDIGFWSKFLLLPEHSVELYLRVMEEIPTDWEKIRFRQGALRSMMSGKFLSLLDISADEYFALCKEVVDGLTVYSDEVTSICGVEQRRFPLPIDDSVHDFCDNYIRDALEWLQRKSNQHINGLQFFMPHWFTAVSYIQKESFGYKSDQTICAELFTLINHYIPEHPSNPGAADKALFVQKFKEHAEQYGFSKAFLTQTWQDAVDNQEDAWVSEIYQCTPENEPLLWAPRHDGPFMPLVYRAAEDVPELHTRIVDLYLQQGFAELDSQLHSPVLVDITHLLTKEFIAEFPGECQRQVRGELRRIRLTDKYMGTDKVHFSLDIIKFTNLPDSTSEAIPRLLVLERAEDHYQADLARRYCANRSYMVDEIKAQTGCQLLRFFGYTHDPDSERAIPPEPRYFFEYEREMEMPFYNVAHMPLLLGDTAFILNGPQDYVYLTE